MCDPGRAATTKRKHTIRPASLPELAKLTAAMPPHQQALILLAAWAVRDLLALRRKEEIESDMLGVAAFAVLMALMPVAVPAV